MKELMKGNEAVAEAAVRGGCRAFFGYPITPQNEIPEYFSWRLPEVGGAYVQAESEVAAINMVYGAGGAGARAMTSSSSPGISLKQEGLSYIACAGVPCVIVNMVRCGPGLGGIQPSQCDYFQSVKGGGHGDYKLLTYGPSSVQECVDILYDAFEKSEKYRVPVMILGDGMLGQIMEPVELPPMKDVTKIPKKDWATYGENHGAERRIINSLLINPDDLEERIHAMFDTYRELEEKETMHEEYLLEDAEIVLTAYGTVARIAKSAVDTLRDAGIKAGLLRPITLFPFPNKAYERAAGIVTVKKFLCIELSMGQMLDDVKIATRMVKPIDFYGRTGGNVMSPEDIVAYVMREEK